jgi:hypothetical protein
MDRKEFLEQKFQKELQARKEGRCWVHGDKLLQSITEPFEGYPSKTIREIDSLYPFHALFVHVGCMPLASDQTHGQQTTICPSCNREASRYLESLEEN